ncbi:hypothetical protein AM1_2795 [Acaryochloris marina MBIC11017]|uniref:Uncharacterized protein n=1 Tax=Acaryochloris marina (strain MBIC 11017) TaxID=329726 RepID=B0C9B4_ACAM1|nr:hypothetical protein AM1_2795 [Acaryochloris marina MBIC11017]
MNWLGRRVIWVLCEPWIRINRSNLQQAVDGWGLVQFMERAGV